MLRFRLGYMSLGGTSAEQNILEMCVFEFQSCFTKNSPNFPEIFGADEQFPEEFLPNFNPELLAQRQEFTDGVQRQICHCSILGIHFTPNCTRALGFRYAHETLWNGIVPTSHAVDDNVSLSLSLSLSDLSSVR